MKFEDSSRAAWIEESASTLLPRVGRCHEVLRPEIRHPAAQDVTIFTLSYAGGANAAGQAIPAGGFDTMLSLFDGTGLLIGLNDNGDASVPADPVTGNHWDAYLFMPSLAPDIYTLAITHADNGAFGPTLADGFLRAGSGNFSGGFIDLSGNQRQAYWAADVIGDLADAPEPSAWVSMLIGVSAIVAMRVRRRRGYE